LHLWAKRPSNNRFMFDGLQEGDKQIYNVSTGNSNGTLSLAGKYYNVFYDLLTIVYCASQCRVVTYVQE
jgi:hypothetical protein